MIHYLKLASLAVAVALLSGCVGSYQTTFDAPVDRVASRNWRVVDVQVSVPASLTVSEAKTLVPSADIVWREDPVGDRKPQIAKILRDAALRGAAPLKGSTPVKLVLQVTRFHALTFEAESRLSDAGVHNIGFFASVVDARTGAVLVGPDEIEADTPAFSGAEATQRRTKGETQRSVISNHVAATVAAWLGVGPDNRGSFSRLGD